MKDTGDMDKHAKDYAKWVGFRKQAFYKNPNY